MNSQQFHFLPFSNTCKKYESTSTVTIYFFCNMFSLKHVGKDISWSIALPYLTLDLQNCQRDTTGVLHLSPFHWSLLAYHKCTGVVHLSWSGSTVPLGYQHTSCRWQLQVVAHVVCTNDTGRYFWEASKLLQKSFPVIKGDKPFIIIHNMGYIVPTSLWPGTLGLHSVQKWKRNDVNINYNVG